MNKDQTISFKYQYIFGTDIAAAIGANGGGGSSGIPDIGQGGTFTPGDVLAGQVNPVFDGGTLNLGGSASLDTSFMIREAGGSINTSGHDLALAGALSGQGALTKRGEGVLTLTGANTQNGLNILGGVVAFNGGGALGVGPVTLNGGALRPLADMTVGQDILIGTGGRGGIDTAGHDLTLGGAIVGGGLEKLGGGVLTLAGINSFSSLNVQGGAVVAGSSQSLGASNGQVTLGSGAGLVAGANMIMSQGLDIQGAGARFDTSGHDVVLTGALTGRDCFIKAGLGRLSLNAAGSNDIGACVQEGQLAFNNVFSGRVWVEDTGTMSGSGRVNGDVEVNGTLSPGNSPGVLVVAGSVTQVAGSTLALDIDGPTAGNGAGHHDALVLTGAGSVYTAGGTLAPITRGITGSATNSYTPQIGDAFQVVEAEGGVVGSFSGITQPTVGMPENSRFDVLYLPKGVVLAVTPTNYAALIAKAGLVNAQAIAAVADRDRAAPGQRGGGVSDGLIGQKRDKIAVTLQQAAGEIHADGIEAVLAGNRATREELTGRLDNGFTSGRKVWGVAGADTARVGMDKTAFGYRTDRSSMIFGIDYLLTPDLLVGAAFSYAENEVDGRLMGSARTASYQGHGYGAWRSGDYYVNGVVSVGQDDYKLNRSVDYSTGRRGYRSNADGTSLSADVEAGRKLALGRAELVLAAGLAADRAERDALKETGDQLGALRFADETREALQARIGGKVATDTQVGAIRLRPQAALFVTHELGDETTSLGARMGETGFTVSAASPGATAVKFATDVEAALSKSTRVGLGYRYGWSESYDSHAIRATASISW